MPQTQSTSPSQMERRSHPRYPVPHRMDASLSLPCGEVRTRVLDVSEGGFGVHAKHPALRELAVGTRQPVVVDYGEIRLEGHITVRAVAVTPSGVRLGLELDTLSPMSRSLLVRILNYLRQHEEFVRTYSMA